MPHKALVNDNSYIQNFNVINTGGDSEVAQNSVEEARSHNAKIWALCLEAITSRVEKKTPDSAIKKN